MKSRPLKPDEIHFKIDLVVKRGEASTFALAYDGKTSLTANNNSGTMAAIRVQVDYTTKDGAS